MCTHIFLCTIYQCMNHESTLYLCYLCRNVYGMKQFFFLLFRVIHNRYEAYDQSFHPFFSVILFSFGSIKNPSQKFLLIFHSVWLQNRNEVKSNEKILNFAMWLKPWRHSYAGSSTTVGVLLDIRLDCIFTSHYTH